MKIAISQPMSGKTKEEIIAERQHIVNQLQELGFEVINTVIDIEDDNYNPVKYLGKSIELMADADAFLFMNGWEKARGCLIEYKVAQDYNKIIIILPKQES